MTARSVRGAESDGGGPHAAFAPGSIIDDRYEVLELLAEGGTASVWRVRHRILGRFFALKALHPGAYRDAEFSERFRREARALATLSHPNIVSLTDFGHLPSGAPYFVMEHVEGEGLERLLARRGRLDVALAVEVALRVAEALVAAHRAGIVHRDLKPSNVWLAPGQGRSGVKVLDFGLARTEGEGRLTRPNACTGTPEYMSPEQARGEPADARSDVYSLGVTLYEMLVGRPPFAGSSHLALAGQHLHAPPPPLTPVLGNHPAAEGLQRLVFRCLEKDRSRRFASAGELLTALGPFGVPAPTVRLARSERPVRKPAARGRSPVPGSASVWSGRWTALRLPVVARWVLVGCAWGGLVLALLHWLGSRGGPP